MFVNAQYHIIMRTLKLNITALSFLTAIILSSCATTGYTPQDDVYYSPDEPATMARTTTVVRETKPTGGTVYEGTLESVEAGGSYENLTSEPVNDTVYLDDDEYYDIDYASRLRKFSDGNDDDVYFDDGGSSYCSSPNISLSFGFGAGYGYGWGYPSYGWGYPYYGWGYPYYGWGGSYWSGYNNGYWNGYWDGYYGGGYYPGNPGYPYYPDYGYRNPVHYGPRGGGRGSSGGRTGGSDVPGSGRGMASVSPGNGTSGGNTASISNGRTKAAIAGGATAKTSTRQRPAGSVRVSDQNKPQNRTATQKKGSTTGKQRVNTKQARPASSSRYSRPAGSKQQVTRGTAARTGSRTYSKPASRSSVNSRNQAPTRYSKPKAYRSLPSQQPRSSKEYVRPSSRTSGNKSYGTRSTSKNVNNAKVGTRTRTTSKSSTMQRRTTTTRSSATRTKSYSSPSKSRSSSSSRSYSSPTRSSGSSHSSGGGFSVEAADHPVHQVADHGAVVAVVAAVVAVDKTSLFI